MRRRGRGEVESGCLLLGTNLEGRRTVVERMFYDDLDPRCADSGGIYLDFRAFGTAWDRCRETGLQVIADVHTHPGLAFQSGIDARNPAVSIPGHVALIVPDFARDGERLETLGVYEYLGEHRWRHISGAAVAAYLEVGWWV